MTEILHMDWPFACVLIALIAGSVIIYGIATAPKA